MLHFSTPTVALHHADCMEALREMEENSIDACVTDPPYETGFMAKKWDKTGIAYQVETWAAILRVLKPGAHLLSFGGTRTHHRMVCAIEDAGFEIRDEIDWVTGQGFPKSLNFDGAWDGWGTALKPAKEPICLARKPVVGTIEANLLALGTGALNINGCRVEHNEDLSSAGDGQVLDTQAMGWGFKRVARDGQLGRWPANVIHDGSPEVMAAFPTTTTGAVKPGTIENGKDAGTFGAYTGRIMPERNGSTGSAARFFYCPKASRSDREEGCEHLPLSQAHENVDREPDTAGLNSPRAGAGRTSGRRNNHPTVKPTELMRYLCRLITPPGGVVLDPFAGSGSTGKAALLEGFRFIGIEREEAYVKIAAARLGQQPTVFADWS